MAKQKLIARPTVKLRCMSVHRVQDTQCLRYYYWRWVLNMVPKMINLAQLFGSTMHKAFEVLPTSMKISNVLKEMAKTNREEIKKRTLAQSDYEEAALQLKIANTIIVTYHRLFAATGKEVAVTHTETKFAVPLKLSPVTLLGTVDGIYHKARRTELIECKTVKSPTPDYFRKLVFDKQINGYAIGAKSVVGRLPTVCHYLAFRKPGIRIKAGEDQDSYIERLIIDLEARADWYFIRYLHKFNPVIVASVLQDIEVITSIIHHRYEELTQQQLLDPQSWPRNDTHCFYYGRCDYFNLCQSCPHQSLYYKFFQTREIRYKQEEAELL